MNACKKKMSCAQKMTETLRDWFEVQARGWAPESPDVVDCFLEKLAMFLDAMSAYTKDYDFVPTHEDELDRLSRTKSMYLWFGVRPLTSIFEEIMARCLTCARKMTPFRMDIAGENLIIRVGRVDVVPLSESLADFDETRRNANKTFFTV
jgi:hypothetical protein